MSVYYLTLSLIVTIITPFLDLNAHFKLPVFCAVGGYLLLGHYIYNIRPFEITNKVLVVCILGIAVVLAVSIVIAICVPGGETIVTGTYFINLTLIATLIFMIICSGRNTIAPPSRAGRVIVYIGRCTFGIFLFERMVRNKLDDWLLYERMREIGISSFLGTLLFQLVVFTVSWILTIVIKKIPVIKKLI